MAVIWEEWSPHSHAHPLSHPPLHSLPPHIKGRESSHLRNSHGQWKSKHYKRDDISARSAQLHFHMDGSSLSLSPCPSLPRLPFLTTARFSHRGLNFMLPPVSSRPPLFLITFFLGKVRAFTKTLKTKILSSWNNREENVTSPHSMFESFSYCNLVEDLVGGPEKYNLLLSYIDIFCKPPLTEDHLNLADASVQMKNAVLSSGRDCLDRILHPHCHEWRRPRNGLARSARSVDSVLQMESLVSTACG